MSTQAATLPVEQRPEPVKRPKMIADGVLGMLIFVFTEVMLFAGLISAHAIVRSQTAGEMWPPYGQPRLPVRRDGGEHCRSSRERHRPALGAVLVQEVRVAGHDTARAGHDSRGVLRLCPGHGMGRVAGRRTHPHVERVRWLFLPHRRCACLACRRGPTRDGMGDIRARRRDASRRLSSALLRPSGTS